MQMCPPHDLFARQQLTEHPAMVTSACFCKYVAL